MKKKIAFIGAGSYGFTFNLISDILSYESLKDCSFAFMDIDRPRLDNLKILLDKYFSQKSYNKKSIYTLDLIESLEGADFIFNLVKIGGLEATQYDMDLPKKYGLYQTVGDTGGIGGVFRGLRTMIYTVNLLRKIENHSSPNAVVLNYTNPQSMLVMIANSVSKIPFIGLCHSVQNTTMQIAKYLNVPYDELVYEAAGINHMNWITKLVQNNTDLYPSFRKRVKEDMINDEEKILKNTRFGRVRLDILNRTGYVVTESSTHFPEYVPFYLRTQDLINKYGIEIDFYKRNIARKQRRLENYINEVKKGSPLKTEKTNEYGPEIIDSIVTGTPRVIYANVINDGLVTNLPDYGAVEVKSVVDLNGVQPCFYGELPPHLAALCRMNINVHQLAVEAVLKKDKRYVYWALMMDPVAHSILTIDEMEDIADALIKKEEKYLRGYLI